MLYLVRISGWLLRAAYTPESAHGIVVAHAGALELEAPTLEEFKKRMKREHYFGISGGRDLAAYLIPVIE
ncbi:hypothetical protein [Chitinophaga rhizosphaerae]|uniref:hypothetical protein n=1 Tax=Chitinophaga rhizosphaerae TaxID=1864947 RepID=UPI0013DEAEAE|nr:hypothetical protein [Chitinophaga rhizosphaerae]